MLRNTVTALTRAHQLSSVQKSHVTQCMIKIRGGKRCDKVEQQGSKVHQHLASIRLCFKAVLERESQVH